MRARSATAGTTLQRDDKSGDALGSVLIALHHIGSTAIPGIAAKPVIDMLAVVTSIEALDRLRPSLSRSGTTRKANSAFLGVSTFARTHWREPAPISSTRSPPVRSTSNRHLDFRDCVRAHPIEGQASEALKRNLAHAHANGRPYSDGKTDFICEVERRAAAWRRTLAAP